MWGNLVQPDEAADGRLLLDVTEGSKRLIIPTHVSAQKLFLIFEKGQNVRFDEHYKLPNKLWDVSDIARIEPVLSSAVLFDGNVLNSLSLSKDGSLLLIGPDMRPWSLQNNEFKTAFRSEMHFGLWQLVVCKPDGRESETLFEFTAPAKPTSVTKFPAG